MSNTFTSLRWLITGGCGFIGTSLIAYLLRNNPVTDIRVLDDFSVGSKEDLYEVVSCVETELGRKTAEIDLMEGDIRDFEACLKACENIDVVVHLAANTGVAPSIEKPRYDMEANVIGTFNMLESAREHKIKKFIFASSGAPIGEVKPPIDESKPARPVSPYGASKLAGEGYCSAFFRTFGVKTISLRFGNVYGTLSKHKNSVVAKFLRLAFEGKPLEIYGDGCQTRDFIYIDDLIQAIILSAKSDIGGETFQIATHKETTVNEICERIKHLMKNRAGINVEVIHSRPRLGDVTKNYSDISKARQMLGYEPEFDIDRGLEKTFQYFKTRNELK